LEETGRDLDRDTVVGRRRERHSTLIARQEILPGVISLLQEAAAADVPVGVASSSSEAWVAGHLERLGVLHHFEVIRCRDHVEQAKPSPDLFLAALDALGADPQRSVALEDSHHGCSAAKAAGLVCVVVPNDVTRGAEFAHADLVLESLGDVSLATLTGLVRARLG
jgi:HAD superfamily hydrolase (TIGR01509 family)